MRILCFLVALAGLAGALSAAVSIEQYHSHDFVFRAPVSGNPFDVEFMGEFLGPGDVRLRVPGFYAGGGVWKIRFSPTRLGEWSLRTISPNRELDGKTEAGIACVANRHANIHGGLRVDAANPHHYDGPPRTGQAEIRRPLPSTLRGDGTTGILQRSRPSSPWRQ